MKTSANLTVNWWHKWGTDTYHYFLIKKYATHYSVLTNHYSPLNYLLLPLPLSPPVALMGPDTVPWVGMWGGCFPPLHCPTGAWCHRSGGTMMAETVWVVSFCFRRQCLDDFIDLCIFTTDYCQWTNWLKYIFIYRKVYAIHIRMHAHIDIPLILKSMSLYLAFN